MSRFSSLFSFFFSSRNSIMATRQFLWTSKDWGWEGEHWRSSGRPISLSDRELHAMSSTSWWLRKFSSLSSSSDTRRNNGEQIELRPGLSITNSRTSTRQLSQARNSPFQSHSTITTQPFVRVLNSFLHPFGLITTMRGIFTPSPWGFVRKWKNWKLRNYYE